LKNINQIKKTFFKVEERIVHNITDENRKEKALKITENFKNSLVNIQKNYDEFNISDNPTFSHMEASETDIQQTLYKMNDLRWEVYNPYVEAHMELVEVTTEDEWPKIVKSINRLF